MDISKTMLEKALSQNIISSQHAEALLDFIQNEQAQTKVFDLTQLLYYFGAFLALSAMSLFMNKSWQTFGGWGIFGLSLLYILLNLWLSTRFQKKSWFIPLCAMIVVCLTALSIYGFQLGMGWWPEGLPYRDYHVGPKWNLIVIEFGTLLMGFFMTYQHRRACLLIPILVTAWFLSIDLWAMVVKTSPDFTSTATVSLYFGLICILLAVLVNRQQPSSIDYASWIYLLGAITFWGGLTCQETRHEFSKIIYLCINLFMMGLGVVLMRKIFDILGAIGCCLYIGHLAAKIFQNSLLFPLSLTLIGFLFVYLGVLWQKNATLITHKVQSLFPKSIHTLLER